MKKSDPISPRLLAVAILREVLGGQPVQQAFSARLRDFSLSPRDTNLCADLVYGYLRKRIKLDFMLGQFLSKPEKLPPDMLILLGLAAYAIFEQAKVPDYAAVNETVQLLKKRFGQPLAKLGNAALRFLQKLGDAYARESWFVEKQGDLWRGRAVFYSLPFAVVELWRGELGEQDTISLMAKSGERPWTGLRINPENSFACQLVEALDEKTKGILAIGAWGFALPPGKLPQTLLGKPLDYWRRNRALTMQSPGSMLVMEKLQLFAWQRPVWDCCAGSGIKAGALLERGVPVTLATDLSLSRLKNLSFFCGGQQVIAPGIALARAQEPPLQAWNGNILADVPCSALGILARRPDIRERTGKPGFWQPVANTQKEILSRLAKLLQPQREIAYITCTVNPAENERQIRACLEDNRHLELIAEWRSPLDQPWLEGMYGALLRRTR